MRTHSVAVDSVRGRASFTQMASRGDALAGLRVAFVAGTLGQGGAEKQLVYMARAFMSVGAQVHVFCLTSGDFYEERLASLGIPCTWFGKSRNRLARMAALVISMREFRPHIVQAVHFYTNLYVWVAARVSGALGIGSIRGDTIDDVAANGFVGKLQLKLPSLLLANSHEAKNNAVRLGVPDRCIHVLGNVIDLAEFDQAKERPCDEFGEQTSIIVMTVCSLLPYKRVDCFLRSLALARANVGNLLGVVVGDGPLRRPLEALAHDLGLMEKGVVFVGRRDDVPAVLSKAHLFVLSSEHEGFPNVILEAMAAGLPVITTNAGDAPAIIRNNVTGLVVPMNDPTRLAECIVELAIDPARRKAFGEAGRRVVEQEYSFPVLGQKISELYRGIAGARVMGSALPTEHRSNHTRA